MCEASFFAYRPVVEANVRVYAVLHEQDPTSTNRAFFQVSAWRFDGLGLTECGGWHHVAVTHSRLGPGLG